MASQNSKFQVRAASELDDIHLPDGRALRGPRGAQVGEFFAHLATQPEAPIVGAVVNGALRELTFCIERESDVTPVTMASPDGMRIYRRTLAMLLGAAFSRLFPHATLNIDHSVFSGGYYCEVVGSDPLTGKDLQKLEAEMRVMAQADMPIERIRVPLDDAIAYFEKEGKRDKVRLLAHRKKDYMMLYDCGGHRDYHHGYMLPSTGYLKWFGLAPINGGFILQFPRRHNPTKILPARAYPKLLETFQQYGKWLQRLGIDSVGALNDAIAGGRIREVVLVSEALHEQRLTNIASQIVARRDEIGIVIIAGPSSSGKTTSSKRLAIQLLAHGISPFPLEMDRFFVDRDKTPRDKEGEFDFEHVGAIDDDRFNHDLKKLIAGERVRLPHYNFQTGLSEEGEEVQLHQGQIVIVEGIHGLNPELLPDIPAERAFRIYLSALTQLNLDHHNRVSTTDTRLIRRIVRDARTRGYSPQETIQRWESVRRGEKLYIFPYQENADAIFNSALVYELSALKPLAEPLLRQVAYGTPEHIEVKRLLALLDWFLPLDTSLIPDNSLLREFVGGSILEEFTLWHNDTQNLTVMEEK
jgi:uridine kinase